MFRLKFVLTFAVLLAALAGLAIFTIQASLVPVALDDTDISLMRSASLVEKSHRIDEFALKEKARYVANRPQLRNVVAADYEGDVESERHRAVHMRLEVNEITFERAAESERVKGQRNLDLELRDRRPLRHDLFMAIDDTGRLIATLGSGLTSRRGDNVGAEFPVVHDAMNDGETIIDMWNWSWRSAEDRELYVVAVAPMTDPVTDEVIGAVILGNRMADSVAERQQALIAGGLGGAAERTLSPREQVQSPDVAFFRGQRIYSSTLRSHEQRALHDGLYNTHDILAQEQPEKILSANIDGEEYRVIVRFFPGQFGTDNPAGIVLLTSADQAVAPLVQARNNIALASVVLLLVGLGFFVFFFHTFLAPFGRLEEGIQEVISGDKDYVFDAEDDHSVAQNLAHHLNLLSAFLQGKPMPDEEQSLGGWGGLAGSSDKPSSSKPSAVAGVPMGLGSKKKDKGNEKKSSVEVADQGAEGTAAKGPDGADEKSEETT